MVMHRYVSFVIFHFLIFSNFYFALILVLVWIERNLISITNLVENASDWH